MRSSLESLRRPVAWAVPVLRAVKLDRAAFLLAFACALPLTATADSLPAPKQAFPLYARECGTCHMAYPPALQSASAWGRVMNGLDRHFGSDASLEPAEATQIRQWLQQNAATDKRATDTHGVLRISEQAWFLRKHREVSPDVWNRPAIKSAAQCNACHGRAEQGAFNERDIRIPR